MVDVMRSNMLLSSILHWMQRQSSLRWHWGVSLAWGSAPGRSGDRGPHRGCGVSGGIRHGMLVRQRCGTGAGWRGHGVSTSGGIIRYSVEPSLNPNLSHRCSNPSRWSNCQAEPSGWARQILMQAYESEKPQHEVTVSAFAISRYPITRELYRELCDTSPQAWERDSDDNRLPANDVNWFDAVSFCNALSRQVGLQPCYRIDGTHVDGTRTLMAIACRLRPNGNTPACGDNVQMVFWR